MRPEIQAILEKYGVKTIVEALDRQMWACIDEIADLYDERR